MRRILAVLLATLAALLGVGAPAATADEGAPAPTTVYAYDYPHMAAAPLLTPPERGPPSAYDHTASYNAADDWSGGALARVRPPVFRSNLCDVSSRSEMTGVSD